MKQHITKEQWKELTTVQQNILLEWLLEKKLGVSYFNVLFGNAAGLNIGQMIAFLGDAFAISKPTVGYSKWYISSISMEEIRSSNLCNLLWEAIKYKLKQ